MSSLQQELLYYFSLIKNQGKPKRAFSEGCLKTKKTPLTTALEDQSFKEALNFWLKVFAFSPGVSNIQATDAAYCEE